MSPIKLFENKEVRTQWDEPETIGIFWDSTVGNISIL